MSGNDRDKTIRAEQMAIKQDNKNTNYVLMNIALIVSLVLGLVYMFDVNTIFIDIVSGIITFIRNGAGSLMGWEDINVASPRSALKVIFAIAYVGSLGAALWLNRMNRQ